MTIMARPRKFSSTAMFEARAGGPSREATSPRLNPFVVVTGLPASGKSTVGTALARDLGLPCIDKDCYLESYFEGASTGDPVLREQLSRRADDMFRAAALQSPGAVLCSWWHHPQSNASSGTPTSWLSELSAPVVEVHCMCPAEIAVDRFLARRRHAGHCDERHARSDLLHMFAEQAWLGPIGVGVLVEVRSEHVVDTAALVRRISRLTSSQPDRSKYTRAEP